MSRFPSPMTADRIGDRIHELPDGFERLGDQDTPFTLRGGGATRDRAQELHIQRNEAVQIRDEDSNEPITRDLDQWQADMDRFDFPFVDTISFSDHRKRAIQVANVAIDYGFVARVDREVEFDTETIRGRFWRGIQLIEIGTNPDDFPGFREGVVLAHELGHAFYDAWTPDSGIEDTPILFQTTEQQEQARRLSERLHGPMIEPDGNIVDYRMGDDEELAAAVFASRIIEPMAAQRIAPDAVRRLETVFGTLSDRLF